MLSSFGRFENLGSRGHDSRSQQSNLLSGAQKIVDARAITPSLCGSALDRLLRRRMLNPEHGLGYPGSPQDDLQFRLTPADGRCRFKLGSRYSLPVSPAESRIDAFAMCDGSQCWAQSPGYRSRLGQHLDRDFCRLTLSSQLHAHDADERQCVLFAYSGSPAVI
jgi:hypothetical protein